MNRELIVTLLRKDIQELDLITESFMEMTEFPKAIIVLAQRKTDDIQSYISQLAVNSIEPNKESDVVEVIQTQEIHDDEQAIEIVKSEDEDNLQQANIQEIVVIEDFVLIDETQVPIEELASQVKTDIILDLDEKIDEEDFADDEDEEDDFDEEDDIEEDDEQEIEEIVEEDLTITDKIIEPAILEIKSEIEAVLVVDPVVIDSIEVAESTIEIAESCEVAEIIEKSEIEYVIEIETTTKSETDLPEIKSISDEPRKTVLGEKNNLITPTRNEILSKTDNSISTSLANKKITDIKQAINIGDRFRFQRELFRGNGEDMNKSISYINQLATLNEALSFLKSKYEWSEDNETAEDFFQIVRRRFI